MRRLLIVAIFAFFVVLAPGVAQAAKASSHQLTCRSGAMGWNYGLNASGASILAVSFSRSKGPAAAGLRNGQCAWSDRRANDTLLCFNTSVQLLQVLPSGQIQTVAFGPNYLNNFLTSQGKLYIFGAHIAPVTQGGGTARPVGNCLWVDKYGP